MSAKSHVRFPPVSAPRLRHSGPWKRKRTTKGPSMTVYTMMASPVGELLLVGESDGNGATLTAVSMPGEKGLAVRGDWARNSGVFTESVAQLQAYSSGQR